MSPTSKSLLEKVVELLIVNCIAGVRGCGRIEKQDLASHLDLMDLKPRRTPRHTQRTRSSKTVSLGG